jgi:hypothetical protein
MTALQRLSRLRAAIAAVAALAALPACSDGAAIAPAPAAKEDFGPLTTTTTEVGPLLTPAGGEDTVCVFKRLDNEQAGYVRNIRGHLSEGSHHMIVYTSKETEEQLEPFPCGGFAGIIEMDEGGGVPGVDSKHVPIFIAQQPEVEIAMPSEDGVPIGFYVEPHQMLRIELHWYNTTPVDTEVTGSLEMDVLPEGHEIIESSFAFWGTVAIDIPPSSKGDTGVLFQRALEDTKGFALTTHQHKLGTRMRVWESDDGATDGARMLVDNTDWADPPMIFLDPPATFEDRRGLAYQCEWDNTTGSPVGFGEGFNDEMCFLWMYYYPSRGFDICVHFNGDAQQGVCNHLLR